MFLLKYMRNIRSKYAINAILCIQASMGCFEDPRQEDFNYLASEDSITIDACIAACAENNYSYAAVQVGAYGCIDADKKQI